MIIFDKRRGLFLIDFKARFHRFDFVVVADEKFLTALFASIPAVKLRYVIGCAANAYASPGQSVFDDVKRNVDIQNDVDIRNLVKRDGLGNGARESVKDISVFAVVV